MFRDIPCNLITGFLGAGKTTVIRHLLGQRPAGESWGVLVNEFGRVGVDGALLDDEGVALQQVVGGCLCCVNSQAFEVGLGRLIRSAHPTRILIEPSGLGHPGRLLQQLSSGHWRDVLDPRATLTLVDAQQLADPRYAEHPLFREQIEVADVLLASKADCSGEADRQRFLELAARQNPPKAQLAFIEQGRIDPSWLDLPRDPARVKAVKTLPKTVTRAEACEIDDAVERPWLRFEQQGEGFCSLGWRWSADCKVDEAGLRLFVDQLEVERIKGLLRLTDDCGLAINCTPGECSMEPTEAPPVSRLEIIDGKAIDADHLERQLRRWVHCTNSGEPT